MSDRGEYRAIRRVLLDGKDFRRLPERARWVFVALKLNLGPAGIETAEPMALVYTLAAQTGMPADAVKRALDELDAAGWIVREENVVWIVGQLEHDPHVKVSDPKHRKSVQRHVAGLPTLAIVGRYIAAHPAWFADADGDLSRRLAGAPLAAPPEGHDRAMTGPSEGHRSTEDNNKPENKPEDEPDPKGLAARAPRRAARSSVPVAEVSAVLAHYASVHPRARPDTDFNRRKVRTRLTEGFTVADLCDAIDGNAADPWCVQQCKTDLEYAIRPDKIQGHIQRAERARLPLVAEDGTLTAEGLALLRTGS